jgi:rhodanese-related sulfurtransferase
MLKSLKSLMGLGPSVDYQQLVKQGAIILDVRSKGEYQQGHIKGSMHIPVDQLSNNLSKLKNKDTVVITCCASGMRSGAAKKILQSNGYREVHNCGSWISLQSKI